MFRFSIHFQLFSLFLFFPQNFTSFWHPKSWTTIGGGFGHMFSMFTPKLREKTNLTHIFVADSVETTSYNGISQEVLVKG